MKNHPTQNKLAFSEKQSQIKIYITNYTQYQHKKRALKLMNRNITIEIYK